MQLERDSTDIWTQLVGRLFCQIGLQSNTKLEFVLTCFDEIFARIFMRRIPRNRQEQFHELISFSRDASVRRKKHEKLDQSKSAANFFRAFHIITHIAVAA